jgi:hypothetical protein
LRFIKKTDYTYPTLGQFSACQTAAAVGLEHDYPSLDPFISQAFQLGKDSGPEENLQTKEKENIHFNKKSFSSGIPSQES